MKRFCINDNEGLSKYKSPVDMSKVSFLAASVATSVPFLYNKSNKKIIMMIIFKQIYDLVNVCIETRLQVLHHSLIRSSPNNKQ